MQKIIGITFLSLLLLIILLITFVGVKTYSNAKKPILSENYYDEFQSNAALEKKFADYGRFEVLLKKYKSDNEILKEYRIWYPADLEHNSQRYPLIIVVNASNLSSSQYEPFFKRLSSWGFIVVGNEDKQTGTGLTASQTLDYMIDLNNKQNNLFFSKIDLNSIGIVGYSQGGAGAINAVTAYDNSDCFKTIFTGSAAYSFLSKNMGWEYDIASIKIPYFMTAGTGKSDDTQVADVTKEFGSVAPLSSLKENYNKLPNNIFKILARVSGAEHEDILVKTDGYMTAWMLYQLQDNKEAGAIFTGKNAEILNNSYWQDIEKNN